jgi:hypothetical protein
MICYKLFNNDVSTNSLHTVQHDEKKAKCEFFNNVEGIGCAVLQGVIDALIWVDEGKLRKCQSQ